MPGRIVDVAVLAGKLAQGDDLLARGLDELRGQHALLIRRHHHDQVGVGDVLAMGLEIARGGVERELDPLVAQDEPRIERHQARVARIRRDAARADGDMLETTRSIFFNSASAMMLRPVLA